MLVNDTPDGPEACTHADLPGNVERLVRSVEAEKGLTPSLAKSFLESSSVTPEDLLPWADFDHPDADSYGRKMVWDGGWFELMVMSWVDGDMAAIHDHGYTQWGAVKLLGPAEHAIFRQSGDRLVTAERREFDSGAVVGVSHDLIHQMGNLGKDPYLTLHLYGCYGRKSDVTADARLFELDEGVIQRTCGGVFFALPEDRIDSREPSPAADFPTKIRHKVELLKRLVKANGSLGSGRFGNARESRLAGELFSGETWEEAARDLAADTGSEAPYLESLRQEMTAAARVQHLLCDTGLVDLPMGRDLEEVLGVTDPEERSWAHADVLAKHLGVELALPLAR